MTRAELNEAIANKCGWSKLPFDCAQPWYEPDGMQCWEEPPDYTSCLNACADAEARLIERKDGQIWRNRTHEYDEWLWWICVPIRNPGREKSHCFPQYATALQRSIALGLTWSLLTQEQADELREGK